MGRRREVLRELMRAFPQPPELEEAMNALYSQPDRVAAIMASAMVETVLERLIRSSFKNQSAERNRAMFEANGPLASLSAKIQIAAAFGVITDAMAEDLTRLKNIRNVFAHAPTNVTFETPEIAAESWSFRMLEAARSVPAIRAEPGYDTFAGKRGFILVAIIFSILMDEDIVRIGGQPVYYRKRRETDAGKEQQ